MPKIIEFVLKNKSFSSLMVSSQII